MDWKRTIGKNRRALAGVIAGLIAMAGHGDPPPAFPAPRHCPHPARDGRRATAKPLPDFARFARRDAPPAFRLIGPRKRFGRTNRRTGLARAMPRISAPDLSDPVRLPKPEDTFRAAGTRCSIMR